VCAGEREGSADVRTMATHVHAVHASQRAASSDDDEREAAPTSLCRPTHFTSLPLALVSSVSSPSADVIH